MSPARTSPFSLEPLEPRQLLSVSLDADGWTAVTPSADTRKIYVSSLLGNDANDGLSQTTPVRTIARGASLLRDGMPDWLLLKRGDSWSGEGLSGWNKSGRSAQEPMLISAYGTGARPLLKTGVYNGFYTQSGSVNNLDIIGIHLYADTRDPASPTYSGPEGGVGIRWLVGSINFLVEDCVIDSYLTNISISGEYGPISNVAIRRNIVTDAYSTTGHSQGAIFSNINGLTIEGNVFDHNGWNEQIVGAEPDIFNHNIYVNADNQNVVVKDNIIANASSHGLQARSGGQISGNIFINNPIGIDFGIVNGSAETAGGVHGFIRDNVFYGSRDINGASRGTAIDLGNIGPGGTTVSGNIMVGNEWSLSPAFQLSEGKYAGLPSGSTGINDLTIENNVIYNWAAALWVDGRMLPGGVGPFALNNLNVRNNDFQKTFSKQMIVLGGLFNSLQEHFSSNRYSSTQSESYPFAVNVEPLSFAGWKDVVEPTAVMQALNYNDPSRSVENYIGSITGEQTVAAFMQEARQQSNSAWHSQYTASAIRDYFNEGFHLTGDLNLDGSVSISDFITLAAHFGQSDQTWTTGDLNGDGMVSISDMIELTSAWGETAPVGLAPTAASAEAIILSSNQSASSQENSHQGSIFSGGTDLASAPDVLTVAESSALVERNLPSTLLTGSSPKRIIRPVWFTYPRR